MNNHICPSDARVAFLQSAAKVLHHTDVHDEQAIKLIGGTGDRRALPLHERRVVYQHWQHLDVLEALGATWVVEEELDGLTSAIRETGARATAALIVDELVGHLDELDVDAIAAGMNQHPMLEEAA